MLGYQIIKSEKIKKILDENFDLAKKNQNLYELNKDLSKENAMLLEMVETLDADKKKMARQKGAYVTNMKIATAKAKELEEQLKALKIRRSTKSRTISSDK